MTVSLVTYRHRPEDIWPVIEAVRRSVNVEKFIVVDNTVDNRGFGAAHTVAIREAMALGVKYHAVENPDIDFAPGTLEAIEAFMDRNPDVGLLMPKTVNSDGSLQYNCKLVPTPFDLFARRFLPKAWTLRRNDRFTLRDLTGKWGSSTNGSSCIQRTSISRAESTHPGGGVSISPARRSSMLMSRPPTAVFGCLAFTFGT